ncbi:MAG: hypothetical protein LUF35_08180 [Lachnospiraceae bacterium]|nr:hypothetical protein [Lachnospiraceae bacterium]
MKKRSVYLFLLLEFCLYVVFLVLDLTGRYSASIPWKYAGICGCFCFAFFSAYHGGDKLVAVAMGMTVFADLFLLVLDRWYIVGLLLFCGVQGVYAKKLTTMNRFDHLIVIRAGLGVVAILALYITNMGSAVNVLAGVYFSQLLVNATAAWNNHEKNGWAFPLGLTFFACCDICVGVYNIGVTVSAVVVEFCRIGMWMFYLPSQIFIVLSGVQKSVSVST